MSADDLPITAIVSVAAPGRYWLRVDAGIVFWDAEGLGDGFGDGLDERQLMAMANMAGHALAHEFPCKTDGHSSADRPTPMHALLRVRMPPEMTVGDAERLRPQIEQAIAEGFDAARKGA